jgi:purine-binding chemotaxis protein CheW
VSPEHDALVRRAEPAVEVDEAVREYLSFMVGAECYALPLTCVREIVRVPALTEVPRAPAAVLGVISVRGAVTTVIDLRRKLNVDPAATGPKNRILVVDGGGERMGLLVDAVAQVHRLLEQEVELASVLGGTAPSYLVGIGRPGSASERSGPRAPRAAAATTMLLLLDPIALLKT